jgi:hypothetical protein
VLTEISTVTGANNLIVLGLRRWFGVVDSNCWFIDNNCDWDPADTELESLACDKCNCWYHYKCAELTGEEAFLNKKKSTWYCCNCSKKGKGKGKGKKK